MWPLIHDSSYHTFSCEVTCKLSGGILFSVKYIRLISQLFVLTDTYMLCFLSSKAKIRKLSP